MLTSIARRLAVTAATGVVVAVLAGCSTSSADPSTTSKPAATKSAASAVETAKPSADSTGAVGDKWLLVTSDGDNELTWSYDTTAGNLRLLNDVARHDDLLYREEPDVVSGDGLTTFGPLESGTTTVTVAALAGGTGDSFDITNLPDAQPGDRVLDAAFDLTTASKFVVEVRSNGVVASRFWQYDANDPSAAPVKVAAVPDGHDGDVYPWGTVDSDTRQILTLTNGQQWQASVSSSAVALFKRASASGSWEKVGTAGTLQDNVELDGSATWFRPADITSLTK